MPHPHDQSQEQASRHGAAAPWFIGAGMLGVGAALAGMPAPLLASLLLVAIGSDTDLRRRFAEAIEAEGVDRNAPVGALASVLLAGHAVLYGALLVFAWASLLDLSKSPMGRVGLALDLALVLVLLVGYTRIAGRRSVART